MRQIKLYIAVSLNGKIARPDGDVDWLEALPNPEKTDHGFMAFYDTIDTTLQGYKTYELLLKRGIEIPSKDKVNYVISRKQDLKDTQYITFVSDDVIPFIRKLKAQPGKDIWLIGGGQTNTLLFNEGLIDEIRVFVMPIVIPDGIGLFEHVPIEKRLHLVESTAYSSGAVELRYRMDAGDPAI